MILSCFVGLGLGILCIVPGSFYLRHIFAFFVITRVSTELASQHDLSCTNLPPTPAGTRRQQNSFVISSILKEMPLGDLLLLFSSPRGALCSFLAPCACGLLLAPAYSQQTLFGLSHTLLRLCLTLLRNSPSWMNLTLARGGVHTPPVIGAPP